MVMRNKIAPVALSCVLGMAAFGISVPAAASDAGAFIGGVLATKVLGNMKDRTEAEQQQAAASQQMASQQRAAPAGGSAEQQLSELKSMKSKGLISTEEYNQKKKQILDSM